MPNYITTAQAAQKWNVTIQRVGVLCREGRVDGAFKHGRDWLIPEDAENPAGDPGRPKQKPGE